METVIPKLSIAFRSLFRADITTQWRNRRAVMLSLLVPVIVLISWKGSMLQLVGGPLTLANSLSYGLIAIGLLGYSNSLARDRDKGIFQRLRVAPMPTWVIMVSRLLVQLLMVLIVTTAIFIVGYKVDEITIPASGYAITYFTAIIGAAVYLSVGQLIVAMVKNPETVNATSRLIFIAFIMSGIFATLYIAKTHDATVQQIMNWSPYGAVNIIMAAGMEPAKWDIHATNALMATFGYIIVFAGIGINKFKWDTK